MKSLKFALLMIVFVMLTSCASLFGNEDDDSNNPFAGMTEKELYSDAKKEIAKGQYTAAAKRLEAMESMYPFSESAEEAQMKLVYIYYKNDDYVSAAASADRFIRLYPRSPGVDYIYYLKGLANFKQTRGTFANFLPMDESWRDPGTQSEAYTDFATLIEKFPTSQYRANAIARMTYLRNSFAKRELNAATYYMDRKMYIAAKERASSLVKTYPQSPLVKEALVVIYKANIALGFKKEAADVAKVYESTYHKKLAK